MTAKRKKKTHTHKGRESVRMFYCSSLPVSYVIDQRRLLFWRRMPSSDNLVLRSLSYFVSSRALAVSSTYGVTTATSVSVGLICSYQFLVCSYVLYVFISVFFPLYSDIGTLRSSCFHCTGISLSFVMCCLMA